MMFNLIVYNLFMTPKFYKPQSVQLEIYRKALESVKNQKEICQIISDYGYTPEKIDEGVDLLVKTKSLYAFNAKEEYQCKRAKSMFKSTYDVQFTIFKSHVKKAVMIYGKESATCEILGISGPIPLSYKKSMNIMYRFYNNILDSGDVLRDFIRSGISHDTLSVARQKLSEIEELKSIYNAVKQNVVSTDDRKSEAFESVKEWMQDFVSTSRVALKDRKELLEVIGF